MIAFEADLHSAAVQESAALRVLLLGPTRIERLGENLSIRRRQARALLYCLASKEYPVPREEICFGFWADKPEAVASRYLSHLVSHLRTSLGDPDLIRHTNDGLELDRERTWCDAVAFSSACSRPHSQNLDTLARAVELYRGPFLSGFSLPAAPEFELWMTEQRSSYERLYLEALATLIARETSASDYVQATHHARRYLRIDNLAEDIHRRLIVLHMLVGDRPAALQQYERCAAALKRELGVDPLPETRAIYDALLQNE